MTGPAFDPAGKSELAVALAAVQAELPRIAKDKTARVQTDKTSYSYQYADLAQVTREVLPLLGRHGLAWITKPTMTPDGSFVLAYKLLHTSGESEDGVYPLPKASTPQAMGSAITYARRYCLCSVTGVTPDSDDDDAASAQAEARPQRSRPVQRQARPDAAQPSLEPRGASSRPARGGDGPPLPGDEPPRGADRPVTEAQLKMLHASFGNVGISNRDDGLAFIGRTIEREVASSKELTTREASKVIEALVAVAEPPAAAAEGGEPS